MPIYTAPRLGISQSEAYREAIACATAGIFEIETLALYHSSFVDDGNVPTAIYLVKAYEPVVATIEADAPLHAGVDVQFTPCPFKLTPPEESDSSKAPTMQLEIDNVNRMVLPYVKAASLSQEPILMIRRIYLSSDKSGPHEMPPPRYVLRGVSATNSSISAKAGFGDLINSSFPRQVYTRVSYPGLIG